MSLAWREVVVQPGDEGLIDGRCLLSAEIVVAVDHDRDVVRVVPVASVAEAEVLIARRGSDYATEWTLVARCPANHPLVQRGQTAPAA